MRKKIKCKTTALCLIYLLFSHFHRNSYIVFHIMSGDKKKKVLFSSTFSLEVEPCQENRDPEESKECYVWPRKFLLPTSYSFFLYSITKAFNVAHLLCVFFWGASWILISTVMTAFVSRSYP